MASAYWNMMVRGVGFVWDPLSVEVEALCALGDEGAVQCLWGVPINLFNFLADPGRLGFGCPTQVRGGNKACTPWLTVGVRADWRIPEGSFELTEVFDAASDWERRLMLESFAYWQRLCASQLGHGLKQDMARVTDLLDQRALVRPGMDLKVWAFARRLAAWAAHFPGLTLHALAMPHMLGVDRGNIERMAALLGVPGTMLLDCGASGASRLLVAVSGMAVVPSPV